MYPHERSLVKKLQHAPFALIGVNSDKDLEDVKPKLAKAGVTWRSFWDGPKGTGGPIATAWGVRGWPTVYILDAEGRICAKTTDMKQIEETVDSLLAKMNQGKTDDAKAGNATGSGD